MSCGGGAYFSTTLLPVESAVRLILLTNQLLTNNQSLDIFQSFLSARVHKLNNMPFLLEF